MRFLTYRALSRTLVGFGDRGEFNLVRLLQEVCREILPSLRAYGVGVSLGIRDARGALCIGVAGQDTLFAEPTIQGLFSELIREGKNLRIIDHALDGGRYLGETIRCSILARAVAPSIISPSGEVVAWIGIGSARTASHEVTQAVCEIAETAADWVRDHAPLIEKWRQLHQAVSEMKLAEHDIRMIAHDLRSPLSLLQQQALSGLSQKASGAGKSELQYIRSLLDLLSKRVRREPCVSAGYESLVEIANRVAARFNQPAKDKNIRIHTCLNVPSEMVVAVPSLVVERMLNNLVENSVRYCQHGGVEISAHVCNEGVSITVSDSGNGFPESVLREINDTARTTLSDSHGWGMGLLAVKSATRQYGGQFSCGRSLNGGALVALVFPIQGSADVALNSEVEAVGDGFSTNETTPFSTEKSVPVLLVDDDVDHAFSLGRVLRQRGVESIQVSSVADALDIIRSDKVRAVLCDACMPDGGAATLLDAVIPVSSDCKVAVMSGDSDDERLYQLASKGAQAFFPKPVEIEDVATWLHQLS